MLLFATGEWRRLIPTSWEIVPQAWQALLGYLSLHIVEAPRYNGLQQLTYAAVVFLLSPLAIATVSSWHSTSAKRGRTSTSSEKPITFIARAVAPTLPGWLVWIRMKRVESTERLGRIG